jgi:hypothetical protein
LSRLISFEKQPSDSLAIQKTITLAEISTAPVISEVIVLSCRCSHNYELIEHLTVMKPEDLISEVEIIEKKEIVGEVYPNPTRDQATLTFEVADEESYQIFIYDLNGKKVLKISSGKLKSGRQVFNLDLEDLNGGMFYLKIASKTQNKILKIIKVN